MVRDPGDVVSVMLRMIVLRQTFSDKIYKGDGNG
jgi:hypothetical protein